MRIGKSNFSVMALSGLDTDWDPHCSKILDPDPDTLIRNTSFSNTPYLMPMPWPDL
jgi:hypothetical protein